LKTLNFIPELVEKIIVNDRIYGIFNLSDLFAFTKGKASNSDDGNFPLVSASKFNNGISGKTNSNLYENCFTIASSGTHTGSTFWHNYKFDATTNVNIAFPKFKIADNNTMNGLAHYISSYLRYKRFNYGRVASICRMEDQVIALPIIKDKIDWKFIHDSYKEVVSEIYKKQIDQIQTKIDNLNTEFINPNF
jgi:hypothetical protein